MSYKTKQKDLILDVIKKEKKEFTVKDIYKDLNEKTGLTTIYRLVDKLVLDNLLAKHIGNDGLTYYQYLEKCEEDNHFYLRCECCKKTIHIDCDCIKELTDHINKNHNFKLNKEHIIIDGLCSKCGR
ncbi:MAG: transcriptional repressor [Bacilli bacterium]|nr:transcriptional repressor [Bacilli bacterium]